MKWLRRIGMLLIGVMIIGAGAAAAVYGMSERRLSARYTVTPESPSPAAADSVLQARGRHVAESLAKCVDCHSSDFGGGIVIDAPPVGHIEATNLTTGNGGVLAEYDDGALERAIRHGIAKDGRSLLVMPSSEYNHLADNDVAALIAYIRSRPSVNRTHAPSTIGPVLRAMWIAGKVDPMPAAVIAHDAPHLKTAPVGNSVETGMYIAQNGCAGCHGATYSGGPIPGGPPDWKPAANITPTGIGRYSLENFRTILREGKRPDGSVVDSMMPVKATRQMTDDEIEAVFKFLNKVPPKEFGNR